MSCFVYILQSQQGQTYYIGYTCSSLEDRLSKHNRPHKGFTGRKQPWVLVYSEAFSSKTEAMTREKEMKSWKSAKMIEELIS